MSQTLSFRASQGLRGSMRVSAMQPRQTAQRQGLVVLARQAEAGVGLFGTKAGMTTVFQKDGKAVPATVIALEDGNIVTQVLTPEKNGYSAVQVGYKVVREKNIKKPELGHCQKAGVPPLRHLREFKVVDSTKVNDYQVGQQLNAEEMFKPGDFVDVAGTSIGKGFQGTIKRWNHARGRMTHGSKSKRQIGSIGQSSQPSRVFPGLHMPGQMGAERVKIQKLQVLLVDTEKRAIVVKGSIPGKPGNVVEITPAKIVGENC